MIDVAFITGGNSGLGFGHAARCMHLARMVKEAGLSCGLFGSFSPEALARIKAIAPDLPAGTDDDIGTPRVAVVDRLSDPDDADAADIIIVEACRSRGSRVLCILSGTTLPNMPGDVTVVGYQPSSVRGGGNVHWGLDYAPVPPQAPALRAGSRDRAHALVALGGHPDLTPLTVISRALAAIKEIRTTDVLISPVAAGTKPDLEFGTHQSVTIRNGVPDVLPLLASAGLVIASFGNLVYEALSLGAPVCVVGQKGFQISISEKLAALGLCVSAGSATPGREADIRSAIEQTLKRRNALSQLALAAIDGRGFERIAAMIVETARRG